MAEEDEELLMMFVQEAGEHLETEIGKRNRGTP